MNSLELCVSGAKFYIVIQHTILLLIYRSSQCTHIKYLVSNWLSPQVYVDISRKCNANFQNLVKLESNFLSIFSDRTVALSTKPHN